MTPRVIKSPKRDLDVDLCKLPLIDHTYYAHEFDAAEDSPIRQKVKKQDSIIRLIKKKIEQINI